MPFPKSLRLPLVLVLVAVVAAVGVGAFFLLRKPPPAPLPGRDSDAYQKYVTFFQVGVAGLSVLAPPAGPDQGKSGEAGIRDLAYRNLTDAIETIPEEP